MRLVNVVIIFFLVFFSRGQIVERITRKCCEGYSGTECTKTACAGLKCGEDPDSICVAIERCGKQIPIFFGINNRVSTKCKQPKLAEENLCPITDICQTNSTCSDVKNRRAVCLGSGTTCDCSSAESWFVFSGFRTGERAECKK